MRIPPPRGEHEGDKTTTPDNEHDIAPTTELDGRNIDLPIKLPHKIANGQTFLSVPLSVDRRPSSPDTLSNPSVDGRASFHSDLETALPNSAEAGAIGKKPWTWRMKLRGFWQRNLGLALVLISQVFGTAMNVTTRVLERDGGHGKGMHPFQVLFARMTITVLLSMLYMWYKRTPYYPFGAPEVRGLLLVRGFGGFFGVFGLYYSLRYLPLSDATVLTFLAPSLACWACSILIKEPFTRAEQIATVISFCGVVLIARPTSFFGRDTNSSSPPASGSPDVAPSAVNSTVLIPSEESTITPAQRLLAVTFAMLGVLGAATAYTTLRWIGKRAHPLITVNYFASWCTLVSIVMMLSVPSIGFLLPQNLYEWTLLISLGICGFVMQFLLAAGLQHEKSSRATNMVYIQMLFALACDKLVWGHTPGWLEAVGSGCILGSAIFVAVRREGSGVKTGDVGSGGEGRSGRDEEMGLVSGMEVRGGEEEEENGDERAVLELRRLRS